MRRVVITGMGALTPIGNNVQEYTEGLKNGISGAGPITRFDASLFRTRFACEVKNLNIEDFMHRREARRMDHLHNMQWLWQMKPLLILDSTWKK